MARNSVFDNTKFLMIFFVVFGHFIEAFLTKSDVIKTLYLSIYSFHMPVFVLLSGMLMKIEFSEHSLKKNLASLVVPLIVFTVLYEALNLFLKHEVSFYTLNLMPYWTLWFFYSLFIWKIILPMILQFRYPFLLSIVIALIAGLVNDVGYFLGVSRTLYFFPFFILGYKLGITGLSNIHLNKIPKVFYMLILVLNVAFFWYFNDYQHQWMYGSFSYERLKFGNEGLLVRAVLYFVSFTTTLSILMLMPSKQSIISRLGENSLYVYIWHGFFVKIALHYGAVEAFKGISTVMTLMILFVLALLLTFLLSARLVATKTQSLILDPMQRLIMPHK